MTTGSHASSFVLASLAGGVTSEITGGKFKNGAATAAFTWALSQGAERVFADSIGDPGGVTDNVIKTFGEDNISVTESESQTKIDISLEVKRGHGLSQEDFESIVSDIEREWNTTATIDGHSYKVSTSLTVDTNILSSGDFKIQPWSSLPSQFQHKSGAFYRGDIYINRGY